MDILECVRLREEMRMGRLLVHGGEVVGVSNSIVVGCWLLSWVLSFVRHLVLLPRGINQRYSQLPKRLLAIEDYLPRQRDHGIVYKVLLRKRERDGK